MHEPTCDIGDSSTAGALSDVGPSAHSCESVRPDWYSGASPFANGRNASPIESLAISEQERGVVDSPLLSVVIPAYNERTTITETLHRVAACGIDHEIIVVDDGSTDGTAELVGSFAGSPKPFLVTHSTNQGKGAAVRTGLLYGRGAIVILQDADLEYDPADYAALIKPIVANEADVVFGNRFSCGSAGSAPSNRLANLLLTAWSNLWSGLELHDMETCYKVFRREVVAKIAPELCENGFGIEPELVGRVARIPGVRVAERPIAYHPRTRAQGKKIRWRDGWTALWCAVKYRRR